MKISKLITVDIDIYKKLKKENASALINKLLQKHYGAIDLGKCPHDWSNAFSTPGGLVKECRLCNETKDIKVK